MAAANLDICIVNWCMCLHVSQVNCEFIDFELLKLMIKILLNSGLVEIFFVFKLLQIHIKGRSFQFNWMHFVFLPNKIKLIASMS